MGILWTVMVYQNDLRYLSTHIRSVLQGDAIPSKILVIDAGADENIRTTVTSFENEILQYFSVGRTETNTGFNPSFNFAVKYAIENQYEYLATMTVRARPHESWLTNGLRAATSDSLIGMVATLHVRESGEGIHSLGHFISPSAALYDYANGAEPRRLGQIVDTLRKQDCRQVWAACSGGAIYRVRALELASATISRHYEILHPSGFKSYNCSHLGYLMRACGFGVEIAPDALCYRAISNSTSWKPASPGLLMNQEINRIASVYTFWPEDLAERALSRYVSEERKDTRLSPVDKRIALTLAKNLVRDWPLKNKIKELLRIHLGYFDCSIRIGKPER